MALAQAAGGREPLGQGVPAAKLSCYPARGNPDTSRADCRPPLGSGALAGGGQAARRRTSQRVMAMSSTDSASSQPPSIHWKGQNRLPGW